MGFLPHMFLPRLAVAENTLTMTILMLWMLRMMMLYLMLLYLMLLLLLRLAVLENNVTMSLIHPARFTIVRTSGRYNETKYFFEDSQIFSGCLEVRGTA